MNGTQSKPKVSYIFIKIIIVQVFIKFGARYGSGHTQPCNLRFTHKIRRRIPYSSVSCGTTPLLLHILSRSAWLCLSVWNIEHLILALGYVWYAHSMPITIYPLFSCFKGVLGPSEARARCQ